MASRHRTRRIGFIGYERITALDLAGPSEVFATANALIAAAAPRTTRPAYDVVVLGLASVRPFRSESGVTFVPDAALSSTSSLDTLIVPGGSGMREAEQMRSASQWLIRHHRAIRRIASVCTGIYALAEAGLLEACTVTTHWRYADAFAQRYPHIRMGTDAIFIKQGKIYTSGGITAGIDLALALVEEDHGTKLALGVARELVVYLKRAGGQSQFSERLSFQTQTSGRLAELAAWMLDHLSTDLSVGRLADRCHLSGRQLSRQFRLAFGMSPAACVERMRTDEAANRLLADGISIDRIAKATGFRSADVFRRAFERRFGVAPAQFRMRFATTADPSNPS